MKTILSSIFILISLFFTNSASAQNQRIFLFETGSVLTKGANARINYVSKWDDSLSGEIGVLWFNNNLTDSIQGDLGINGRISYKLDFLSIIPSIYVGLGTGVNLQNSSQNFMLFEYGVTADYMYSRKIYLGLGFGGFTITKSDVNSTDSNSLISSSSFLINFRLTWITGEEW